MVTRFSSYLALMALTIMVLRGLFDREAFTETMASALTAAIGFYALGLFCGEAARRLVEVSVDAEIDRWKRELLSSAHSPDAGQPG